MKQASAKKEEMNKETGTEKATAEIDNNIAVLDILTKMNQDMGKIREVMEVQSEEIKKLKEATPVKPNIQGVKTPSAETYYELDVPPI